MPPLVEVRHLSKKFRGTASRSQHISAINDVSLDLLEGEITAVIGENGAGKSTLTKLILGLVLPTTGEIKVFGVPIGSQPCSDRMGYVPESFDGSGEFTSQDLLLFSLRLHGLRRRDAHGVLDSILVETGLVEFAHRPVKELSRGMLARLSIAQALVGPPRIVFMDEPSKGLDPVGKSWVRTKLTELRANGVGVLLNSHDLSEVGCLADKIVLLKSGSIVMDCYLKDIYLRRVEYAVETERQPDSEKWHSIRKGGRWITLVIGELAVHRFLDDMKLEQIAVLSINRDQSSIEDFLLNFAFNRTDD